MTTLATNLTAQEQSAVTATLPDVPVRVGEVTSRLERIRDYLDLRQTRALPPLPSSVWGPVHRAFMLNQDDRRVHDRISQIIRRYNAARDIIARTDCLISHYTGSDYANIWGYAPPTPRSDMRYEIQVGGQFVTPTGDYLNAVQTCGPSAVAEPGLLRVCTLIHEAMHWVVVTPGHADLGEIRDPYNFEFYMLESRCQVPASIVDNYRTPVGT